MKAVVLERPQEFRFFDAPEPPAPGPGEAVVRVHRVGICGTDYGGYLGKMPFYSYPRVPGHELGVEVLSVGAGVTNVKPGDRCSVEPYINCQKCYSCLRGFTNCCEKHQTLGVMCDGGMAERFLLPARKLHVSTKLTYDQLALVETLAIGCHAVDRAAPKAGETVLVIGAGPIGLSAVEFVKVSTLGVGLFDFGERGVFVLDLEVDLPALDVAGDGLDELAERFAGVGQHREDGAHGDDARVGVEVFGEVEVPGEFPAEDGLLLGERAFHEDVPDA